MSDGCLTPASGAPFVREYWVRMGFHCAWFICDFVSADPMFGYEVWTNVATEIWVYEGFMRTWARLIHAYTKAGMEENGPGVWVIMDARI